MEFLDNSSEWPLVVCYASVYNGILLSIRNNISIYEEESERDVNAPSSSTVKGDIDLESLCEWSCELSIDISAPTTGGRSEATAWGCISRGRTL